MLIKFKQFVEEISAENGRNYKISVLEKYKNDEDIRYLLDFIYNPYVTTGISNKKLSKNIDKNLKRFLAFSFYEVLEYIKTYNTGTDACIATVQDFRDSVVDDADKGLYNAIVTKNIQLGVDSKTINKVIPGLIPEFKVMLANKYFDKPEVVNGKEFVLTTKIDGSRIIAMKNNGEVSFWTRQGQKYIGLADLENKKKNITDDNFVLDGELVAIDTSLEDTYKNTMKLSRTKDEEKHGLKMLVFDYMPIANWLIQNCPVSYWSRRGMLALFFDLNELHYFEKLPILYKGTDTFKIVEILDEQVNKGEEGIMINICDAPYVFGRTNNLLKVKKFQDTELKVIGIEEGTNKLTGTLGALVCEYKNNTVKVGSGLTDDYRNYLWNNQDKIIGKYITVKYFEESKDSKTGLPSLRFPIFLRIREDI